MEIIAPPVLRMVHAACARCGRESGMCAKICFRLGRATSKKFDPGVMTCANCRERKRGHWIVAHGWQRPDADGEPRLRGQTFAEWARENQPLDDFDEKDDQ